MAWFVSMVSALVVLCAMPAQAQNYPAKPIHVLVPYAPGGITDIASRIVGAKLTEAWGQQVVVENKPGGNGFIAMTAAAKAAPDGYTLVMATGGDVAINPAMFKEMPYDVERDFAPIAAVSDAPLVLAVHGASPYKSVADVIAAAKAQPGRLSVGYPRQRQHQPDRAGVDGAQHRHQVPAHPLQGRRAGLGRARRRRRAARYFGELVGGAARQVRTHPRAGGDHGEALESQSGLADPAGAGRERCRRLKLDRAVRTQGHAAPIIDKLNAEVVKILAMPDVKERFAGGGVDTIPSSSGRTRRAREAGPRALPPIVQKANIRPD